MQILEAAVAQQKSDQKINKNQQIPGSILIPGKLFKTKALTQFFRPTKLGFYIYTYCNAVTEVLWFENVFAKIAFSLFCD
jgi:hypothetical protein